MSIFAPSFYKEPPADFIFKRREISDVTNTKDCLVTTVEEHGYEIGQFVRLHVSPRYGMVLNGVKAKIISIPSTTIFTTNLDNSQNNVYVTPTYSDGNGFTQSHCVPITGTEQNIA